MENERAALSDRLPEYVFSRVHRDIGQASMCWGKPENAGVFDADKASAIAFELCHFIADFVDLKVGKPEK